MRNFQRAFHYIDRYAEQLMQAENIPGLAIAVTDRARLLRLSAYGVADIAACLPVTPDTRFQIGSLGKPFTSIALLQLHDEGKLDLHAPVAQYLPWFEVQSDYPPITVHHLMTHTAGIIRGTDLAPHGLYESWALRQTKVRTPPGTHFCYSNIGYKTLGFLLEALTGKPLQEVVRSRVLEPLGMTQSDPVITHATRRHLATGYCGFYDDRPEHSSHGLAPAIWAEYGTGDGCQASTAGDMSRYLRMLLNRGRDNDGCLLSEASFDLMTRPMIWTGYNHYGYGFATYSVDGCTYVGHGGGNAGYRSALMMNMDAGLGVVFLLNVWGETESIVNAAIHLLAVLQAAQNEVELPCLPPAREPSLIANAVDYAGSYRSDRRTFRLTAEAGKLLLTYDDQVVVLERRGEDLFYVGHPDFDLFLLEFQRRSGDVVEALHGSDWYINDDYSGPLQFVYPEEWEAYLGHYCARNPELSNFRVVLRKGSLVFISAWGISEALVPLDDGSFRVGADEKAPETLRFDAVVGGRALLAEYSGCPYYRAFTP